MALVSSTFTSCIYGQGDFQTLYNLTSILGITLIYDNTIHVISQDSDGGATEADGGASVPVGPSVTTPLYVRRARASYIAPILH